MRISVLPDGHSTHKNTYLVQISDRGDLLQTHKLLAHVAEGSLRREMSSYGSQVPVEANGTKLHPHISFKSSMKGI